jgi:hypothetical protein
MRWRDLAHSLDPLTCERWSSDPLPSPRGGGSGSPSAAGAPAETSDLSAGQPGSNTRPAAIAAASRPVARKPDLLEDGLRHRFRSPHQECTHNIHSPASPVKSLLPERAVTLIVRPSSFYNNILRRQVLYPTPEGPTGVNRFIPPGDPLILDTGDSPAFTISFNPSSRGMGEPCSRFVV